MATTGYYELENDYTDSSGNARHGSTIGAGATFSQSNPLPIRGSYLSRFAANNAVSVPTSVFTAGMETTGSIKISFFTDPDSSGKTLSLCMLLHADFGANGDLWVHTHGRDFEVKIPTVVGGEVHKTSTAILQWGKWYDAYINWTPTTLKVYLNDTSTDTTRLIIDVTPANTPKFTGTTLVLIGNFDDNKAAWNTDNPIDHVAFFDTAVTDDGITNAVEHQFLTVGHSMVYGNNIPLGYREAFFDIFKELALHYNLVGSFAYGADVMAANGGIAGNTVEDIDARIDAELDSIFVNNGTRQHIILGPMVTNNCTAGTALATVKTSIESIMTKIEAHNSTIDIFLVTDPVRTAAPTNVDDYNAKVREVYNESARKGAGVYLIDVYTQTIQLSGDGLHPDKTGYDAMGTYIANIVNYILNPASAPALTNATYFKRSLLRVNSDIGFQLNLGTTLDTSININKYIVNLNDVNEKLTKSSTTTGGVVLPSIKIKLDNSRGEWNKGGNKFKNGFVNNSLITLTTNYLDDYDSAITPSFVYKGLIKYSSCKWDRESFIFEAQLSPPSGVLASEKIAPGILSNNTFKNIVYKILNRQPFTKYMTIDLSNITMGWDVSATDSVADMVNKKVKDVLDKIMLLTGSIYYVNYDQEFIVEPIEETSPSASATLRGHDIFRINSEDYYWNGQYTSIVWDDDTNTVQRSEMNYPDRELYQYDYIELKLTDKYVTNTTNRDTIIANLLSLYKFLKRKVKIECKWNPDIKINDYITLDIPEEAIKDDDNFIWNETQWNDSNFWGLAQPGISFSSVALWRVVEVKRDAMGEKMSLTLIQQNSDDEN